ncbi:MAG: hypothetical protein ACOC0P_00645, partial [Planctomycetota bacterium]
PNRITFIPPHRRTAAPPHVHVEAIRLRCASMLTAAMAFALPSASSTATAMSTTSSDSTANAFVAVELPAPKLWSTAISSGTVLDVNAEGWACGWVDDGGGNGSQPFVFDPRVPETESASGEMTLLPLPSGYATGEATAMIDGNEPSTLRVVGTVENPAGTHSEAVIWTSNATTWSVDYVVGPASAPQRSEATGIFDDETNIIVTGHQRSLNANTSYRSFQKIIGGAFTWHPVGGLGDENFSNDITVVGSTTTSAGSRYIGTATDPTAFHWSGATAVDVHPVPYLASGVSAINTFTDGPDTLTDLVGWVQGSVGTIRPAFWRHQVGTPDCLVFIPIMGLYDSYANDINDSREIVGTAFDVATGDAVEAFIWSYNNGSPQNHELTDITKFAEYHSGHVIREANALNDRGWIGGSLQRNGATNAVPCLLVPFDIDNNAVPDYREIISSVAPIDDGEPAGIADNWIPDHFEGMRVGLYPGGLTSSIRNVQNRVEHMHAVRMHLGYDMVYAIVNGLPADGGQTWTQKFGCAINQLGDGSIDGSTINGPAKEIIVTIRSTGGGASPPLSDDYDYLPPFPVSGGGVSLLYDDALQDLGVFAYRQARCIDFIQFGNEWLTGPGQWYFRVGDLPDSGGSGLLRDGIPSNAYPEAMTVLSSWWTDQLHTAQAASALSGRPLRFVTPAVHPETITLGAEGNPALSPVENFDIGTPNGQTNRTTVAMVTVVGFANTTGTALDIHMHYEDPLLVKEMECLDDIVDPSSPWAAPELLTCLEWSVLPDAGWWDDQNRREAAKYIVGTTEDPPSGTAWATILNDWKSYSNGYDDDLRMDTILQEFADHGLLHACYGDFSQGPIGIYQFDGKNWGDLDRYDFTAIIAEQVKSGYEDDPTYNFSNVVLTDLEAAAAGHPLPPGWVAPHDGTEACGCGTGP